MKYDHFFPTSLQDAKRVQEELKDQIIQTDSFTVDEIKWVAGIDVGFENAGNTTRAALVVLSWPHLEVVERVLSRGPTVFPYVPGFLSFREIPEILRGFERLHQIPDLIFCDGQGIAHPRRMGIASHLGVLLGIPTIGVAKSILVGRHAEVGEAKGSAQPLIYKGNIVGMVLRTRAKVKPVYISLGHKISLSTAVDCVLRGTTKYRLPQPTHLAHRLASLEKDVKANH